MNCYYSNLIEGHDTHPVDIERALKNDYSRDEKKRDLQLEAKAHIIVQQGIDTGALRGGLAVKTEGILNQSGVVFPPEEPKRAMRLPGFINLSR